MPSRRTYLVGCGGALAGLTGCLGASAPGDSATRSTTTRSTTTPSTQTDPLTVPQQLPWGEPGTVDGTTVKPVDATVQHSAFYLTTPDSMDVLSFGDRQAVFVTLELDGDGPEPTPGDFALGVDGGSEGWTEYGDVDGHRFYYQSTPLPHADDGRGWVGFDAPDAVDAADPGVRVQFGGDEEDALRWSLPERVTTTLRADPPSFEVSDFHAPDSVDGDEPIAVSATVRNTGDGPGVFRGVLNQTGPLYAPESVRLPLDPGESVEWSTTISTHLRVDTDRVSFDFLVPGVEHERVVEVESATTSEREPPVRHEFTDTGFRIH